MKRKYLITLSALFLIFIIPFIANAAEIEDPYYIQWASFKVGSNTSLAGTADDSTGHSTFTQTITLKELGKDYLTIQISRKENSKSIVKTKKVERFASKTDKVQYLGQEDLVLGGKTFKCQKYTLTIFDNAGKEMMKFDYWFHPYIPGAAKIVSSSNYGADRGLGTSSATQAAVSWEKK
jgi:hypothetical protein